MLQVSQPPVGTSHEWPQHYGSIHRDQKISFASLTQVPDSTQTHYPKTPKDEIPEDPGKGQKLLRFLNEKLLPVIQSTTKKEVLGKLQVYGVDFEIDLEENEKFYLRLRENQEILFEWEGQDFSEISEQVAKIMLSHARLMKKQGAEPTSVPHPTHLKKKFEYTYHFCKEQKQVKGSSLPVSINGNSYHFYEQSGLLCRKEVKKLGIDKVRKLAETYFAKYHPSEKITSFSMPFFLPYKLQYTQKPTASQDTTQKEVHPKIKKLRERFEAFRKEYTQEKVKQPSHGGYQIQAIKRYRKDVEVERDFAKLVLELSASENKGLLGKDSLMSDVRSISSTMEHRMDFSRMELTRQLELRKLISTDQYDLEHGPAIRSLYFELEERLSLFKKVAEYDPSYQEIVRNIRSLDLHPESEFIRGMEKFLNDNKPFLPKSPTEIRRQQISSFFSKTLGSIFPSPPTDHYYMHVSPDRHKEYVNQQRIYNSLQSLQNYQWTMRNANQ